MTSYLDQWHIVGKVLDRFVVRWQLGCGWRSYKNEKKAKRKEETGEAGEEVENEEEENDGMETEEW